MGGNAHMQRLKTRTQRNHSAILYLLEPLQRGSRLRAVLQTLLLCGQGFLGGALHSVHTVQNIALRRLRHNIHFT
jgi:hypothetical protein